MQSVSQNDLNSLLYAAGIGACVAPYVAPLGMVGGALYGAFGYLSGKVVHHIFPGLLRVDDQNPRFNDLKKFAAEFFIRLVATWKMFCWCVRPLLFSTAVVLHTTLIATSFVPMILIAAYQGE